MQFIRSYVIILRQGIFILFSNTSVNKIHQLQGYNNFFPRIEKIN